MASNSKWVTAVVCVVALAAAAGGFYYFHNRAAKPANEAQAKPPGTPVTVATVRKGDFPVYLTGLGTVEPFDTVTVSSRVDGEITQVFFRQGQTVAQGDKLAQIDPRPYQATLDQATAKRDADQANLKNAQLNLERYKTLGQKDFASQQQIDTQQASADQLGAQVKGDQAAIENAQTELSYTTITSPLTGRTGFRLVDPGNIVHASGTAGIVTVVKLQPISVVFTAPEEEVNRINQALDAGPVPVDAMSSDGNTKLAEGKLALVNNQVDSASGDIRMKAVFENKDNKLWPGLSVSTRLLVDTVKDGIIVPAPAVQRGPEGLFVYVVESGNKAKLQPVKVTQDSDQLSLISSGLKEGDSVVIAGQSRLADGSDVDPKPEPTASASPAQNTADATGTH